MDPFGAFETKEEEKEEKEEEKEEKRSSIHQRYLEEKDEVNIYLSKPRDPIQPT